MSLGLRSNVLTCRSVLFLSAIAALTGCTALLGSFDVGSTSPLVEGGSEAGSSDAPSDGPVVVDDGGDGGRDGGDAGCKVPSGGVLFDDAVMVAPGSDHTCAIRQDGALYCWGDNAFGQLGIPQVTALSSNKPVKVVFPGLGAATITQVAVSETTSFAIDSELHLWAWGNNESGLLANGTKDSLPHDVPALVRNGTTPMLVRKLAPEWFSACALLTTGDVVCWGANGSGELGSVQPVGTESFVPVKAFAGSVGATGPNAILAPGLGSAYTCLALGGPADGLRCWGNKSQGVLLADLGNTPPYNALNFQAMNPLVAAGAKPPLAQVVYGTNFGAALDSVGRAFTWGTNNSSGQHGTTGAPAPGTAAGIPGGPWRFLATGYVQVCAISTTGRLHCRGSNTQGQLGRDTSAASSNQLMDPVVAGPLAIDKPLENVASVGMGFFHTCAILGGACGPKGPGQLKCWGNGAKGQLGDDSINSSPYPVDVKAP